MANRNNVSGWSVVGGKKCYFKSLLEYRYACYLQILKMGGLVKDWFYEPRIFRFTKGHIPEKFAGKTCGATKYTPDFQVIDKHGIKSWHECKGYLDARDFTKLKAFALYYDLPRVYVCELPKGKTAKSRNKLIRINKLRDAHGYSIKDISSDFRTKKFKGMCQLVTQQPEGK